MVDKSRRMLGTMERDTQVLQHLSQGATTLKGMSGATGVPANLLYIALGRLRQEELVEKVRTSTRVPLWQITPKGAEVAGVPMPPTIAAYVKPEKPAAEAAPEVAPEPAPEGAPEQPAPVFQPGF